MCPPPTVFLAAYLPPQGYTVQGDIKIELFTDKTSGIALLESEPRTSETNAAGASPLAPSPSAKLGSVGAKSFSHSIKAAKEGLVNGLTGPQGMDGAPPALGADRQLVMYTWLHIWMDPGSAPVVHLSAEQLDKGLKVGWQCASRAPKPTPFCAAAPCSSHPPFAPAVGSLSSRS